MVNFSPLTAEICWRVWGTPANFNGFRVLASLLQQCRSTEVNQTARCLAMSWTGTLYIHLPGLLPHNGILPHAKFTFLHPTLAFSYIFQHFCTALKQWMSAKVCGIVQGMELWHFRRGHDLYSAGWSTRWALAHILVSSIISSFCN